MSNVAGAAIVLRDVSVIQDGVPILERISATIPAGQVAAIIGPNGAGKTTLLRAILGLVPYQGRVEVRGEPGRAPRIGYVPQRLDFDRAGPITVLDFLVMGRQRMPVWFGATASARRRAAECLARVQVEHLIGRPLGKLSGGELQRVQLALSLQHEPEILLLDEPVAGVDVVGEQLFCDLIEMIQRESKLTVVLVSHDLTVVSHHASHVLCLNRRLVCEGPTPATLTQENIERIFGSHMGIYEHHAHAPHRHAATAPGTEGA